MFYEINVSSPAGHLFATAERSCRNEAEALTVYKLLVTAFPKEKGYQVMITKYETHGTRCFVGQNSILPE